MASSSSRLRPSSSRLRPLSSRLRPSSHLRVPSERDRALRMQKEELEKLQKEVNWGQRELDQVELNWAEEDEAIKQKKAEKKEVDPQRNLTNSHYRTENERLEREYKEAIAKATEKARRIRDEGKAKNEAQRVQSLALANQREDKIESELHQWEFRHDDTTTIMEERRSKLGKRQLEINTLRGKIQRLEQDGKGNQPSKSLLSSQVTAGPMTEHKEPTKAPVPAIVNKQAIKAWEEHKFRLKIELEEFQIVETQQFEKAATAKAALHAARGTSETHLIKKQKAQEKRSKDLETAKSRYEQALQEIQRIREEEEGNIEGEYKDTWGEEEEKREEEIKREIDKREVQHAFANGMAAEAELKSDSLKRNIPRVNQILVRLDPNYIVDDQERADDGVAGFDVEMKGSDDKEVANSRKSGTSGGSVNNSGSNAGAPEHNNIHAHGTHGAKRSSLSSDGENLDSSPRSKKRQRTGSKAVTFDPMQI